MFISLTSSSTGFIWDFWLNITVKKISRDTIPLGIVLVLNWITLCFFIVFTKLDSFLGELYSKQVYVLTPSDRSV